MKKFWLTIRQYITKFGMVPPQSQAATTRMVIDRAIIKMSDDEWHNSQRGNYPRQRLQKRFR